MPEEVQEVAFIIKTCKFFGCLPSALLNEDATLLRLLTIYERAGLGQDQSEDPNES